MKFRHPEVVAQWPKPNYVNPETRGPVLYIVNGTFFFLASVVVVTRLYSRIFIRRWFGLDDALILVAWVGFVTLLPIVSYSNNIQISGMGDMSTVFWGYAHYDWDRHLWDAR